jgi:hypothetical protein
VLPELPEPSCSVFVEDVEAVPPVEVLFEQEAKKKLPAKERIITIFFDIHSCKSNFSP